MNKENKKENKFNFVSLDEIEELEEMKKGFISENNDEDETDNIKEEIEIDDFSAEDKVEEIPSENEIKEEDKHQEEEVISESINEERNDSKEEIEIEDFSTEVKVEEPPLEKEDKLKKVENNKKEESIKKTYFGFEARVLTYIIVILVIFLVGCYFALEAINFGKNRTITYNEESTISYKVCNSNGNCTANNDVVKAENLDRISVLFNYSKEY